MKILNSLKRFWNTKGTLCLSFVCGTREREKSLWGIQAKTTKRIQSEPADIHSDWRFITLHLGVVSITLMSRWIDETKKAVS